MVALLLSAFAVLGSQADALNLIACPDCEKMVSRRAVHCPHCGCPAKAIAAVRKLPFLAVNHLEGHALTVRLTQELEFPYLLLLVSGGHCQLLAVEGVGAYHRLGTTLDDALGEAFDKTAKLLGLGYPGGPAVELAAAAVSVLLLNHLLI